MKITRHMGLVAEADDTLYQAEQVVGVFEADAAIVNGAAIMPDFASDQTGKRVITSDDQHKTRGVYNGKCTRGSGIDAIDGDYIEAVLFGPVTALVDGSSVAVAAADALVSNASGKHVKVATPPADVAASALGSEAVTTDTTSIIHVAYM